jgi:septal ring factor EnvC (AmiA/AmiB activator)
LHHEAVGQADRLRQKVMALRRELDRSERAAADRVARLDAVLARRDRTIAEHRARMEGLQHVLNTVLASSSWRLTRPVRGVVHLLRRLRERR